MADATHKFEKVVGLCDWCGYEVRASVEVRTTVTVTGVELGANDVATITSARIVEVGISHVCHSPKGPDHGE